MNDPAFSRLDLLRFLERVQQADLERTRRWIADEERRERERLQGERARPPAPDWLIEHGLDKANVVAVHVGGCWVAKKSGRCRGVSREQAIDALRQQVTACTHCRPDTELGILD